MIGTSKKIILKPYQDNYILTDPEDHEMQLQKMAWTPIYYAQVIKHDCTPYDKNYEKYIEKTLGNNTLRMSVY